MNYLIAAEPDDGKHFLSRSYFQWQLGKYVEAKQDFEKSWVLKDSLSVRDQSSVLANLDRWKDAVALLENAKDANDLEACHRLSRLALFRLHLRDTDGYRQACREMFARLPKTMTPGDASWTTWVSVLGPDALPDMNPLLQLSRPDPVRNGNQGSNISAVLYRKGEYQEAIKDLEPRLPKTGEVDPIKWWSTHVFLAMAHHRAGHAKEAQEYLAKVRQSVSKDRPLYWNERLPRDILLSEAEAMIEGKPKEAGK